MRFRRRPRAGAVCYALAIAALVAGCAGVIGGPEWIEHASGRSPDGGGGGLEAGLVVVPLVVAIVLALVGRVLRRPVPVAA
jgi:hypothetical protein